MKKSLAFLTGICLALSSGFISAAIIGGWNVGNPTPVGAAGLVIASKSVGDVAKTSKALITPNASQVSKILRGGVAGVALTVAVNELLDGIDWVMDPANNQIRYKVITDGTVLYYRVFDGSANWINYPDLNSAYDAQFSKYCTTPASISSPWKLVAGNNIYDQTYKCGSSWFMIRRVDSAGPSQTEKTLPLDTASQKVIDKAEAGNTDAQVATVAAAQDILNEAENDAEKAKPIVQQLENNSTNCNSDDPDPEDVNCGIEPTEHSKLRASEGRPVGKVVNDIQRARNSDIFIQTSNNRFIVRGVNSREHIVSKDAEHITTVELRTTKQHNKLLNQGDRRFATQAEIDLLKSFIK
ncbi:hypothetical protein [Acinetobacter guillouiae]|uniref:hypothetical protein n=1 Tax=Acinetobacter guillouiae TaxID=106649 RepID=UPI002E2399BC